MMMMMMMMMCRVMCVLAVVLCCACGYTMTAAATTPVKAGRPKAVMAFIDFGFPYFQGSSRGKQTSAGRGNGGTTDHLTNEEGRDISAERGESGGVAHSEGLRSGADPLGNALSPDPSQVQATLSQSTVITESDGDDSIARNQQDPSEKAKEDSTANGGKPLQHSFSSTEIAAPGDVNPTTAGSPSTESLPSCKEATGSTSSTDALDSQVTASLTSDRHSAEGVDSNQEKPQPQSENTVPSLQETNSTTTPSTENTTSGDHNTSQQPSSASVDVTASSNSQDPNPTIPPSPENTNTEAPTTTPFPSPVPKAEINTNNITSTLKNKANADSSISPVWMRTAAPLLIVALLFSATVY
ncbi:uncharacterized protein TM35_000761010 [Trypanosoma theileri]|uniref:Mucin TcMUCII n=1 Tax=Trypanosoma theileri TaxID=67003 RepID=A0A1X0NFM7_9TRYP|nr:uncharacterized protein TM35_000761010 [Trypanosoma theileri]ORC83156.1 hypothetical protein TM35_000761010 [Trypanosoma theileri]